MLQQYKRHIFCARRGLKMKNKLTQAKYKCRKGCGCKMCKPQKGGHDNFRTVRDRRLSQGHADQLKEEAVDESIDKMRSQHGNTLKNLR